MYILHVNLLYKPAHGLNEIGGEILDLRMPIPRTSKRVLLMRLGEMVEFLLGAVMSGKGTDTAGMSLQSHLNSLKKLVGDDGEIRMS